MTKLVTYFMSKNEDGVYVETSRREGIPVLPKSPPLLIDLPPSMFSVVKDSNAPVQDQRED